MATATIKKTVFVQDTKIEQWIKSFDVEFSGPIAINLSAIDDKASKKNQARPEPIIEDAVEAYHQALRNGADLPAIIVFPNGKYFTTVDGNNRIKAAQKYGATRVNAYIIDSKTPSETLLMMTMAANSINGIAPDRTWKLRQATVAIANGWTKELVAKHLNVPISAIDGYERTQNATRRAKTLRITGWDTIPVSTRDTLARVKLDPVFTELTEAVITYALKNTPELRQIVTTVNRESSEGAALETAKRWVTTQRAEAQQLRRMGRVRNITNPKNGLLSGLGQIDNFSLTQFHSIFAADTDRDVLSDRINKAVVKLVEMQAKIKGVAETSDWILNVATSLE